MNTMLILEIVATISGIVCVFGQTKEKIWAWPFGVLSVAILVFIFYHKTLYSDTILHVVYVALNLYGWWHWTRQRGQNSMDSKVAIRTFQKRDWSIALLVLVVGTGIWGWAMSHTNASFVYVDAFTTVGSLLAQFLLAKKIHSKLDFLDCCRCRRNKRLSAQRNLPHCRLVYHIFWL